MIVELGDCKTTGQFALYLLSLDTRTRWLTYVTVMFRDCYLDDHLQLGKLVCIVSRWCDNCGA